MIGIDTNVLVRYIAQDDATQSRRATSFIEKECNEAAPGFVGLVVLVEVVWVSESRYGATRQEVAGIVLRILSIKPGGTRRGDCLESPASFRIKQGGPRRLSGRPFCSCGRVQGRGDFR